MAEMVICLLVAIATTLGAAGRATGLLSTLPRTVVDFLGLSWIFSGPSRISLELPRISSGLTRIFSGLTRIFSGLG